MVQGRRQDLILGGGGETNLGGGDPKICSRFARNFFGLNTINRFLPSQNPKFSKIFRKIGEKVAKIKKKWEKLKKKIGKVDFFLNFPKILGGGDALPPPKIG